MILGRNRHGVPTAWVDDGEWVINQQSSNRYHQLLGLVNRDDPRVHHLAGLNNGGQAGQARLASTVATSSTPNITVSGTEIDYNQLGHSVATALRENPPQLPAINLDGRKVYSAFLGVQHRFTRR